MDTCLTLTLLHDTVHRHILIYTNSLHCIVISSAFCQLSIKTDDDDDDDDDETKSLRLQAKWYSNSLCWLKQLIAPKLNSLLYYFAV